MQYKDKDILKAIREGKDHKALEALYRTLYPKIKKLVNSGVEKEEECKDILQESLLIYNSISISFDNISYGRCLKNRPGTESTAQA